MYVYVCIIRIIITLLGILIKAVSYVALIFLKLSGCRGAYIYGDVMTVFVR